MTDNHAICRAHLALVMPEVRKATTPEQRKAAWPWRTGTNLGQGHEFHGPDNYYWHGRACCLWEARAKGWQAWLNAQAPTPEPPRTKYVDIDNNARQHAPWPCVVCGRATDNRYRLHLVAIKGAPCAVHPNDESTRGANDLGDHPIGPECMKAQGLTAWAHGPKPGQPKLSREGAQVAQALARAARGIPNDEEQRERWERLDLADNQTKRGAE